MDRHAYACGRLLQLYVAFSSATNDDDKSNIREECVELLDSLGQLPTAVSATSAVALTSTARHVKAAVQPPPPPGAPSPVVPESEAPASQTQQEAKRRTNKHTDKETEVEVDVSAERDKELEAIRRLLAAMRDKAGNVNATVKASDDAVSAHAQNLARVARNVQDADRKLQTLEHGGARKGTFAHLLSRVPVVGPTILAPMAAIIMQAVWLAMAVGLTVMCVGAMLVLPKAR